MPSYPEKTHLVSGAHILSWMFWKRHWQGTLKSHAYWDFKYASDLKWPSSPFPISHLLCNYVLCLETSGDRSPTSLVLQGLRMLPKEKLLSNGVLRKSDPTSQCSAVTSTYLSSEQRVLCAVTPAFAEDALWIPSESDQSRLNSRFSSHRICNFWVSHLTSLSFDFSHL